MSLKEYLWDQKMILLLEMLFILVFSLMLTGFGINAFATIYVISIQGIFLSLQWDIIFAESISFTVN